MFVLGYNTNGLAHHRPLDALELLDGLGYEGMALTPDVGQLDPYRLDRSEVRSLADAARELGFSLAVETGARYLMDRDRKHFPTLLEEEPFERERRVDFLRRSIDLAGELGATVVSFWSGASPSGERAANGSEQLWDRLCEGIVPVVEHARAAKMPLAFEPEPGMFVERPGEYDELLRRLGSAGEDLGLCLDVGHCLCTGDLPVEAVVERYADRLLQVHLDDIQGGMHEHRMFGEGDLDLPATLGALVRSGYPGMAAVELSRDSHRGPKAAREALEALRKALTSIP